MSSIRQTAERFFEACETGRGWEACREYCHEGATFEAQAEALTGVDTVESYTEWMKGLVAIMPDSHYELKSFGVDEERNNVAAVATFHGTHTEEGGPVPPTGKSTASDYVYVIEFGEGKVRHMTKVWNDSHAMRELGWA